MSKITKTEAEKLAFRMFIILLKNVFKKIELTEMQTT